MEKVSHEKKWKTGKRMLYLPPMLQSKNFLKLKNKSVQGKITMHFVLTSFSCTDTTIIMHWLL